VKYRRKNLSNGAIKKFQSVSPFSRFMTRQLCEFVTERKGRDIRRGRRANHRGGRRRRRDDDATTTRRPGRNEPTASIFFRPSTVRPWVRARGRRSIGRSVGRLEPRRGEPWAPLFALPPAAPPQTNCRAGHVHRHRVCPPSGFATTTTTTRATPTTKRSGENLPP